MTTPPPSPSPGSPPESPASPPESPGSPPPWGNPILAELRRVRRFCGLFLVALAGVVLAGSALVHHKLTGSYRWGAKGSRIWFRLANLALDIRVRAAGRRPEGAVLLAANHISWVDISAVGSLVPAVFVAKAEIRSWPVMGWLSYGGGTLFIPRGAGQARIIASQMADRLAEGVSVLIFPEGTTTNGSYLRPFFPRLFAAAQEAARREDGDAHGDPLVAGATVQPVAIRYLPPPGTRQGFPHGVHPTAPFVDDDPFVSHLLRMTRGPAINIEVYFCEPFVLDGEEDRRGIAQRARAAVAEAMGME